MHGNGVRENRCYFLPENSNLSAHWLRSYCVQWPNKGTRTVSNPFIQIWFAWINHARTVIFCVDNQFWLTSLVRPEKNNGACRSFHKNTCTHIRTHGYRQRSSRRFFQQWKLFQWTKYKHRIKHAKQWFATQRTLARWFGISFHITIIIFWRINVNIHNLCMYSFFVYWSVFLVLLVVAAACSGGGDRSISGPATITPKRGRDIGTTTTTTTCHAFDYARADYVIIINK